MAGRAHGQAAQPGRITESLVARAHHGNRAAFDRLFALAADRALLFIRLRLSRKLRSRLESMDVLQEVYVEALGAFERFEYRGDDSFSRSLCRLIENRIRGLADHFGAAEELEDDTREALLLRFFQGRSGWDARASYRSARLPWRPSRRRSSGWGPTRRS